jgi:hypothetical protein
VVEKWNPHAKIRQDLFGFIDVVALEPGKRGVLAVQACRTDDQSTRIAKIHAEPRAAVWLKAKNRIQVIGWAKRGPQDTRKRWTVSITDIETIGGTP